MREFAGALVALLFGLQLVDFFFQFADAADGVFFRLPVSFQGIGLLAQRAEFLFDLAEPLARVRVGFLAQSLALDFKLHDAALDLVDFRGKGVDLHAQTGGGFIDQVDRFVGQKAIRDIALRKHRSGNDGSVLDAHAVVHFVAFFQAAQNRDRIFHRRLADKHRLEAAFERGILFDVLAIFIERGGADGAQFAASQRRLQHVGRVHRAFGRARTHERVQLVDKQNHLAVGFGDFLQNGFETVFEFAAVFRAGHQCGEIESDNALWASALRERHRQRCAARGPPRWPSCPRPARRSERDYFSCGAREFASRGEFLRRGRSPDRVCRGARAR